MVLKTIFNGQCIQRSFDFVYVLIPILIRKRKKPNGLNIDIAEIRIEQPIIKINKKII